MATSQRVRRPPSTKMPRNPPKKNKRPVKKAPKKAPKAPAGSKASKDPSVPEFPEVPEAPNIPEFDQPTTLYIVTLRQGDSSTGTSDIINGMELRGVYDSLENANKWAETLFEDRKKRVKKTLEWEIAKHVEEETGIRVKANLLPGDNIHIALCHSLRRIKKHSNLRHELETTKVVAIEPTELQLQGQIVMVNLMRIPMTDEEILEQILDKTQDCAQAFVRTEYSVCLGEGKALCEPYKTGISGFNEGGFGEGDALAHFTIQARGIWCRDDVWIYETEEHHLRTEPGWS